MFKRILVAYDGSEGAQAALTMGIGLAKSPRTELYSISVEEHLPRYAATIGEVEDAREQIDEHFRAVTKQARDSAALQGVDLESVVRQGHELQAILDFARQRRCDLLLLGSQGHSRVFERVIGSTSLSLIRLASCSVLIVRSQRGADGLAGIKRILELENQVAALQQRVAELQIDLEAAMAAAQRREHERRQPVNLPVRLPVPQTTALVVWRPAPRPHTSFPFDGDR